VGVLTGEKDIINDREEQRGGAGVFRTYEKAGMIVRGLEAENLNVAVKGIGPLPARGRVAVDGFLDQKEVSRGVVGRVAAIPAIEVVSEEGRHTHIADVMRG